MWSLSGEQSLFGSENYNDVVRKASIEPWEGWVQVDYKEILVARYWEWWSYSKKWLWEWGFDYLKEANFHFMIWCVFS